MSKNILLMLFLLFIQVFSYKTVAAIGDWKAYMAYHEVQEIEEAGNLVFVQASNSLYVYNKNDQSIQTFSKVDYLSDCKIAHIAYNKTAKRLVILYSNGNIDLMNTQNFEVTNLSDYYNASMTEDKTVYDIYTNGNFAYLSTGFGIIKLNVSKVEISDTYNLGFQVNWCEIDGNTIYAYSQTKGKYCAKLSDNLLDKNSWSRVGEYTAKPEEDKSALKQLVSTLNPGGPKYNYFGFMKFANGQLYTCGGGYNIIQDLMRPGCIQVLSNNTWTVYEDELLSKTGVSYVDINCIDIDPTHTDTLFASGRTGLYKFADGKFVKHYSYDNSPLTSAFITDKNYVIIQGLIFNKQGELWVLNSLSNTENILTYNKGKWNSFPKSDLYSLGNLSQLFIDSRNYLWFCNDNWQKPALFRYNITNNSLSSYTSFSNQDATALSITELGNIKEDNNHNIWIGTNAGPILIEQKETEQSVPTFTQVKVPRNDGTNYADYLLNEVNIRCIAVDKANRKWLGTKVNGVYVIDNDNITQLQHFTTNNSSLLSDAIESIAINDETGEVYFGTDKGLCSYQSDANYINEEMTKDNVWAYPNPVEPNYTGFITITGLSAKANVKIVTSNGTLVNQGTSNGGTYTWDGTDLKGKRVASGIYMVETATTEGNKGTVCKIAIVR